MEMANYSANAVKVPSLVPALLCGRLPEETEEERRLLVWTRQGVMT
jgi:hypothetical protein